MGVPVFDMSIGDVHRKDCRHCERVRCLWHLGSVTYQYHNHAINNALKELTTSCIEGLSRLSIRCKAN
eukprot:1717358-Amphidinium_carterae.1